MRLLLFGLLLGLFASSQVRGQGYVAPGNDSLKSKSRFGIGLYAGIANAFIQKKTSPEVGPSYLVSALFQIGKRWDMEIGVGGTYYAGKSLNYYESAVVFDTVNYKKFNITALAYATVPILFHYRLSEHSRLSMGVRISDVIYARGSGTYGNYWPSNKDSFISRSTLVPDLPTKANHLDIAGVAGYEFAFSPHFLASLYVNAGAIPIFPSDLPNVTESGIGNYNVSVEFGLHYIFTAHQK